MLVILLALVHVGCGSNGGQKEVVPAGSGILTPVKWYFTVNKISDTEAELQMKATIEDGWHLYSMEQESDSGPNSGPISLTFEFEKSPHYSLDGEIKEPTPKKAHEAIFEMDVKFYEHEVVYKQKIKILTKDAFTVTGLLNFQTCNDEMCIPPADEEFKFEIPGSGGA